MPVQKPNQEIRGQPTLRFERAGVMFESQIALRDISLAVNRGATIVIFGAAGSGKTVLLKAAIGLVTLDSGSVWLFGRDITNWQEERLFPLREYVGVLFQEGGLFDSMTVEENVAYPLQNRSREKLTESEVHTKVQQALDFVELGDAGPRFPDELSGGMRRRVGIARAMVGDPCLVLYDSPTAGLDPITAHRIMTLVVKQRDTSDATSVLVTQRYQDGYILANFRFDPRSETLQPATGNLPETRFIVLRGGQIAFQGSQSELFESRDPYVARFAGKRLPAVKSGPCGPGLELNDQIPLFR